MTKRDATKASRLLEKNPGLSYRDMRDLLMEYGLSGTEASELAAGRL